LICTDDTPIN
jgi:lysophospholipase L1-like esterase